METTPPMLEKPTTRRRAPIYATVLTAAAVLGGSSPARAQDPEPISTQPATEPTATEPTATEPTATEPTALLPTAAEVTTTEPTAAEATTEPAPTLRQTAPESGTGLITGGTYLLAGGTALIVSASYLAATQTPDWAGAIVGGAALAGGGALFVWLGTRRARKLRAWSEQTGLTPPPSGAALLISGLTLAGGGAISMIAYGGLTIGYCEENCFNPNTGVWFGLAGTAVGTGLGMVIAGGILRARYKRWRESDDLVRARITPSFAFSPTGAQFGIAGRF